MTGMLNEKGVSKLILNKMAESGLDLSQLILAYKRDNEKGIQNVLSGKKKDGHVRVTATKSIQRKIHNYIEQIVAH